MRNSKTKCAPLPVYVWKPRKSFASTKPDLAVGPTCGHLSSAAAGVTGIQPGLLYGQRRHGEVVRASARRIRSDRFGNGD